MDNNNNKNITKTIDNEINIGEYLKKLRLKNDLTQTEIAKRLGVKRSTYSNYEQNLREPNLSVLSTLSKEFNVDLNEIITGNKLKPSFTLNQELYECGQNFLREFESYEKQMGNEYIHIFDEEKKMLIETYYKITKAYLVSVKSIPFERIYLSKNLPKL